MTREPVVVIGIGADGSAGLAPDALSHIERADVLAGGQRHLDYFPDFRGDKIVVGADLDRLVGWLQELSRTRKTVVLASGDPLFYGMGTVLLRVFPADELLFLPHVSSVQLAFARLKQTWHDARVVSLHGRPLDRLLPALRERAAKIAVLTDGTNNPAAIAAFLHAQGCDDAYTIWVCENLGGPAERVRRWRPGDASFAALNVVVLLAEAPADAAPRAVPLLGIPEEALRHRGLITQREVRLLSVCYLEPRPGEILWDVGAGSGSVAIEAGRLAADLRVFAVEKAAESFHHVLDNVRHFALANVQPVLGEAPEALAGLPDPDAVFLGGSGGRLGEILTEAGRRLRPGGRLVMNCITLENLARGWDGLTTLGFAPEATSIQLAHSRPLGNLHCLEPEHMIFILRGRKPVAPRKDECAALNPHVDTSRGKI